RPGARRRQPLAARLGHELRLSLAGVDAGQRRAAVADGAAGQDVLEPPAAGRRGLGLEDERELADGAAGPLLTTFVGALVTDGLVGWGVHRRVPARVERRSRATRFHCELGARPRRGPPSR